MGWVGSASLRGASLGGLTARGAKDARGRKGLFIEFVRGGRYG
jgi:hypothetical protein